MSIPEGFDWDERQMTKCLKDTGISFYEACEVFYGNFIESQTERGHEKRWVAIGRLPWGLIVAVVYTWREGDRRLIWVRPASKDERHEYNLEFPDNG